MRYSKLLFFAFSLIILYIFFKLISKDKSAHVSEENKNETNKFFDISQIRSKTNLFYESILKSEKHIYSLNGEDGVLQRLIDVVRINKLRGVYVEFNTGSGFQSKTRY